MTGVVGHPVSEKGKRGGSPSPAYNGNASQQDRTRLLSRKRDWDGETASSHSREARYSGREALV